MVLEALGPPGYLTNCQVGAKELLPVILEMGRLSDIYLSVGPNAGLPECGQGKTVFPEIHLRRWLR